MTTNPNELPTTADPARTALLVMDYQAGILDRLEGSDELLERMHGAIALVRDAGGVIGSVRVAFTDEDLAAIPATSMLAARVGTSRGAFHVDSPATAVHDRVGPRAGDITVRKTRVGAFSTTDLDEQLRARGIDSLILAGISTSGVVLSTIREAHDLDYRIFVLADGCADPDVDAHDFLTTKIFPRQGEVLTIAALPSRLAPERS